MFRKQAGKNSPIETSTEKKRKRLRIRPLLLGTALTAYTVFTLLDAFVIPKDIVTLESVQAAAASGSETAGSSAGSDESQMGSDGTSGQDSSSSGSADDASVITSDSYQADGVSITLTEERAYDTQIYIADIQLDDPSELLAGLADNSFGRNLSDETSSMAESLGSGSALKGCLQHRRRGDDIFQSAARDF